MHDRIQEIFISGKNLPLASVALENSAMAANSKNSHLSITF